MSEDQQENGNSSGEVPEIELIIKVSRRLRGALFLFMEISHHKKKYERIMEVIFCEIKTVL